MKLVRNIANQISLEEQYRFIKDVLIDLRKLWVENPEVRNDDLKDKIFKYRNTLKQLHIELRC